MQILVSVIDETATNGGGQTKLRGKYKLNNQSSNRHLPAFSEQTEDGIIAISAVFATSAAAAVDVPPLAAGLGWVSTITGGAVLYNNIAQSINTMGSIFSRDNIIDMGLFIGSAANPIFGAITTWTYTIPKEIKDQK